ncbi:unnamed protein product, partial [Ectocarpus sp. 4 AP-2014]
MNGAPCESCACFLPMLLLYRQPQNRERPPPLLVVLLQKVRPEAFGLLHWRQKNIMLTRKQQWMRIRVRRRDPGNTGGNTSSKKHRGQPQQRQPQHDACGGVDQEEKEDGGCTSTSSSGTMSTFSSFDSLEAVDVDDS